MRLTLRYLISLVAVMSIRIETARGQALNGQVLRLTPTALPSACNTGDIRIDTTATNAARICKANSWITFLATDNGFTNPTTSAGDMMYNNGFGVVRLPIGSIGTILGTDGISPSWNLLLNSNVSSTAGITYTKLNLTASVVNADIAAGAAIADTKLATLSTSGKVSNSATTATPINTTSAIVARDSSGNFTAGTIFAALTGTASQAGTAAFASVAGTAAFASVAGTASFTTAFVTTPTACSATQFANAIGANGNLTCSVVSTASNAGTAAFANGFSGVVAIANGGTNNGTLSTTAGGILYMDGSKVMNMGAGTTGQAIRSAGASTPVWRTTLRTIQRYTSGATTYTLPTGVTQIHVLLVGPGGGGGGNGGNGTASSATTIFGSGLLVGGAGGGGIAGGGTASCVGGTASLGVAFGFTVDGGVGGGGGNVVGAQGGSGGSSALGGNGGGGGGNSGSGQAARTNSGSGGGGSGSAAGGSSQGGCAGGYIDAWITTPAGTYTVSIATAGAAGPGSPPGGIGGAGQIVVEEYY